MREDRRDAARDTCLREGRERILEGSDRLGRGAAIVRYDASSIELDRLAPSHARFAMPESGLRDVRRQHVDRRRRRAREHFAREAARDVLCVETDERREAEDLLLTDDV